MTRSKADRLFALDGLRGAAALVVAVYHMPGLFGVNLFPSGYLAVDLFFAISGFVLSREYSHAVADWSGQAAFIRARFIRLYPLYATAVVVSAGLIAVAIASGQSRLWTWGQLAGAMAFSLALLPAPPTLPALTSAFPLVIPAWSLFVELMIAGLFAVASARLSNRGLAILVTVSAGSLCLSDTLAGSLDLGATVPTLCGGLIRGVFSFALGMALARVPLTAVPSVPSVMPALGIEQPPPGGPG